MSDVCSSDLEQSDALFDHRQHILPIGESLQVDTIDLDIVLWPRQGSDRRGALDAEHRKSIARKSLDRKFIARPSTQETTGFILNHDQRIALARAVIRWRSEEHTSELQSLLRISYAV